RANFLNPLLVPSTKVAADRAMSLALIRPKRTRFYWKEKNTSDIKLEREAYRTASQQISFLDKELAALMPCPYEFKFSYHTEDDVKHEATCDDWETTAMFYSFQRRYGTDRALAEMAQVFNNIYPAKGMVFAMGTHSRYPDVWLLVGVLRLDKLYQYALAL